MLRVSVKSDDDNIDEDNENDNADDNACLIAWFVLVI